MNRREFIKASFVCFTASGFLGIRALPYFVSSEELPASQHSDFMLMLYSELRSYPKGSVAHSIGKIETLIDPDDENNEILRGLSYSIDRNKVAQWKIKVDDTFKHRFMTDIEYRRMFMDNIIMDGVRFHWKNKGIQWGVSPHRQLYANGWC